jgi:hypothetical protein
LQKELDAVLAKHGLKSTGFNITVISTNQSGGQTAYSITNNYNGIKQRTLSKDQLADIIFHIPNKTWTINIESSGDKESITYAGEIIDNLKKAGYTNFEYDPFSIHEPCFDTIQFRSYPNESMTRIVVCPASNVSK